MRHVSLGRVPAKRHVQFRRNGAGSPLLIEEVLGYEGFSGNESILYHLHSPCRLREVGDFTPDRARRVGARRPRAPARRRQPGRVRWRPALRPAAADVQQRHRGVDLQADRARSRASTATARATRSSTSTAAPASLRTVFGRVPFRERDYVVIPRGTTHTFELDEAVEQFWMCFHTPGEIETPNRYRNRYGQLLEHAPFSQRDFHPPSELETVEETGSWQVTVRVRDGFQRYVLDRHPFDVVGWDGYVWPYTFNADDFEPRAGRFHLPPPAHQTFQGPNFVICTFAPRMLDWDPEAVPLPYHHSNIQSEEVMFYAAGDYAARKGVDVGCLTLHPSGLPHGPQPGTVEKALGAKSTNELAVMWDTFRPLRLTTLWRAHDDPIYAYSWSEQAAGV